MRKKVLILIGHQQAMVNFCSLFKSMDMDTFAPPFIDSQEKNSLAIYANNSTISSEYLINNYNFFDENMSEQTAEIIYSVIESMNFDLIISYFFVPWVLNSRLMRLNSFKYFLVWGDEYSDPLFRYKENHHWESQFAKSYNSKYLFCHKHLLEIVPPTLSSDKFIQVNIPNQDMSTLESSWRLDVESGPNVFPENRVLIVCSRVFSSHKNTSFGLASCRRWLLALFNSNPDIEFILVGKDNSNILNQQIPNNVVLNECSDINQVFEFMQNCKLMLHFHPILLGKMSGNIIQYSQIEASCIGIPMLHCSKTRITDHIEFNENFTFPINDYPDLIFDHNSLSVKLRHLLSKSRAELKEMTLYQRQLYKNYKISNVRSDFLNYI